MSRSFWSKSRQHCWLILLWLCSKVIEECFNFNFKDELKGVEVDKDDADYSFKKKDARIVIKKDGDHYKSLKTFIVKIKDKEKVKKAMEVFVDTVNFDPACFKGAIRNEKLANFLPTKYCINYIKCEP